MRNRDACGNFAVAALDRRRIVLHVGGRRSGIRSGRSGCRGISGNHRRRGSCRRRERALIAQYWFACGCLRPSRRFAAIRHESFIIIAMRIFHVSSIHHPAHNSAGSQPTPSPQPRARLGTQLLRRASVYTAQARTRLARICFRREPSL